MRRCAGLGFVVISLVVDGGCSQDPEAWVGALVPHSLAGFVDQQRLSGPTLVWVFRTQDCLRCSRFLPWLRRAQRSGAEVDLIALHVGDDDAMDDVRRFIARERVAFDLLTFSGKDAEELDREGLTLPFVMAVSDQRVAALYIYGRRSSAAAIQAFLLEQEAPERVLGRGHPTGLGL